MASRRELKTDDSGSEAKIHPVSSPRDDNPEHLEQLILFVTNIIKKIQAIKTDRKLAKDNLIKQLEICKPPTETKEDILVIYEQCISKLTKTIIEAWYAIRNSRFGSATWLTKGSKLEIVWKK